MPGCWYMYITALAAQAFCWLCGHATGYQHTWSEIDNHSCGRYKEEADKRIDQAQRNNQRYQHYCLRWCAIPLYTVFSSCALQPATRRSATTSATNTTACAGA